MATTKRYKLNFTLADGSTKSVECDIPVSEGVTSLFINATGDDLQGQVSLGQGFTYNKSNKLIKVDSSTIPCNVKEGWFSPSNIQSAIESLGLVIGGLYIHHIDFRYSIGSSQGISTDESLKFILIDTAPGQYRSWKTMANTLTTHSIIIPLQQNFQTQNSSYIAVSMEPIQRGIRVRYYNNGVYNSRHILYNDNMSSSSDALYFKDDVYSLMDLFD